MRKVVVSSLAIGLLIVLGALRVTDLMASRHETIQVMRARVASDALVLAEYVGGTFGAADAALRQLALHSRRVGGPTAADVEWAPSLASAGAGLRGIGALTVVDRALVIRHSNRPSLINQSRQEDRTFAEALTDARADRLVIGMPFTPAAGRQDPLIPVGRPLTDARGRIEGFVVASFLPAELRRFFQRISVGTSGVVWVFHDIGEILVREPSAANPMGAPAQGNAIFAAATRGAEQGFVDGPATPGGSDMISGYRRVADLPLVVAVSLDRNEILAPWRREVNAFLLAHGGVSAVVIGVLVVLFRQMDAKAEAERALQAARQAEAVRLRETNDQLSTLLGREQAARREAEEANTLKDQFVMTVSHELRTPLTAIAGWSRMLVDGMVGDDKRDEALRTIERNAEAQKRLIEDLLDVAGLMAGKLRLEIRPIHVAEMVQTAVAAIAPATAAKGVGLEVAIDPGAGTIPADAERLQQIVSNLLANAVKFTPSGGRVSISATRKASALVIEVADTGMGISPDLLPHVFERFRQGTGQRPRRHGGLGLGLTIVRNLVELHGGTVTAASDGEGRGARFDVVLPAA